MALKSIRIKLIYAFLAIALLTALSIYLLARLTTSTRLRQLILEQQITEIQAEVANWYTVEQGWEGFDAYYASLHPTLNDRPADAPAGAPPPPQGERRAVPPQIGVITADQVTLVGTFATEVGEAFPDVHMIFALPVEVDDEVVAYVVRDDEAGVSLAAEEQIYLRNTNLTLSIASVGGIGLALLMGLGLARILVRPIQDLTNATQAMAQGNLEQKVPIRSDDELGQLAKTFNQMSRDLAQATAARRQMTADIAHDLGTPLQVISGYVESMVDGTLEPTQERIGFISTEIEHLRRLINDLDLLSQTDSQSLNLQLQTINPATLLQQAAQSFTPLAIGEGIQLATDISADLPSIYADQERLMQVMGNLLSNSLRYNANGQKIIIVGKQKDNKVLIEVKDNGSGISAEDLPHIFDRFYRADSSRTEGGKMGLGLAISKALVEEMDGTIVAESLGIGSGTTIRILLPKSA
ncbi:MAG: ATP-binding protein [Chloroflexota bacterium]